MKSFAVLLLSCALFYICSDAVPQFSIEDSNVPEVRYELNAIETLAEAYVLYPNNTKSRTEAFAILYGDIYNVTDGWNVAGDCNLFYTSKNRLFVNIKVTDANVTNIIRIFN